MAEIAVVTCVSCLRECLTGVDTFSHRKVILNKVKKVKNLCCNSVADPGFDLTGDVDLDWACQPGGGGERQSVC